MNELRAAVRSWRAATILAERHDEQTVAGPFNDVWAQWSKRGDKLWKQVAERERAMIELVTRRLGT